MTVTISTYDYRKKENRSGCFPGNLNCSHLKSGPILLPQMEGQQEQQRKIQRTVLYGNELCIKA